VDDIAVHGDLEDAAGGRHERQGSDLILEVMQQLVRQTDGFR
jgi:hypothetical protein